MTSSLYAVSTSSPDPARLARFWGELLGREVVDDPYGAHALAATDAPGYRLRFTRDDAPKVAQNRIHFDLTSASPDQMTETIERALALGAERIDIGQTPDDGHEVMADPDGNEFCVIEPGNNFLSETGFIGAINCDGSQAVGYFWSAALDWPLVWDQDEETAIQSHEGGSKIAWGGPPVAAKHGRERLTLDLLLDPDSEYDAEVERLISLGATEIDAPVGADWREFRDPDDNDFRLFASA